MKYNYYIQVASIKYCTPIYSYLRTILIECTFCIVSMKIKYYNQEPQYNDEVLICEFMFGFRAKFQTFW